MRSQNEVVKRTKQNGRGPQQAGRSEGLHEGKNKQAKQARGASASDPARKSAQFMMHEDPMELQKR